MTGSRLLGSDAVERFHFEFGGGLRRQANVVFALIFKEFRTKSLGRSAMSLFWVMLEPAAQILVLCMFWLLLKRSHIDGIDIALFITVGMLPFSIIQSSLLSIPRALKANEAFYNYQQVKPIDAIIARFALDWVLLSIGGAIALFLLDWFFALSISFDRPLEFIAMLLLASAMGYGASLALATFAALYEIVGKVVKLASRGLLILSGVFYSVNDLPTAARHFLAWNPIAHVVEFARYYALGAKPFPEASMGYAMLSALVLVFLGHTVYYANRYKVVEKR
jgi:capsular polysaccharide transport system permease protein